MRPVRLAAYTDSAREVVSVFGHKRLGEAELRILSERMSGLNSLSALQELDDDWDDVGLMRRGVVSAAMTTCSKKRMARSIASRAYALVGNCKVLTLTYGKQIPDWQDSKRHLDAFRKRILRRYPDAWGWWLMEAQSRNAIHYHLLLCLPEDDCFEEWVREAWIGITGYGGSGRQWRRHRAVWIQNFNDAAGLVSYYIGEVSKAKQKRFKQPSGRWWGVIGRANLPDAQLPQLVDVNDDDYQDRLCEVNALLNPHFEFIKQQGDDNRLRLWFGGRAAQYIWTGCAEIKHWLLQHVSARKYDLQYWHYDGSKFVLANT